MIIQDHQQGSSWPAVEDIVLKDIKRYSKIFEISSKVQADRHAVHVPAGRRRGSVDVRVRVNLKGNISAGTPAGEKEE